MCTCIMLIISICITRYWYISASVSVIDFQGRCGLQTVCERKLERNRGMSLEHDLGQIRTCISVNSSLCILTTIPWVCQALVLLVFRIHGHSHRLELLCQYDCGVAPVAWLWSKTAQAWPGHTAQPLQPLYWGLFIWAKTSTHRKPTL